MARERRLGRLVNHDDGGVLEVPLPRADAPSRPPQLLTNRPFLWLVVGDSFSQLGRWGFFLAVIGDATFRLDASPSQIALLIGFFSIPLVLVSPFYGSAADRWSAKWLLVLTSFAAIPVPIIALSTGSLRWLYVAAALYGLVYAAEMPCRGALVPRLVGENELVRANGMLSAALAIQMVVGPGIGALLSALGGSTAPYYVTLAAASLATLTYLLLVPDRRRERGSERGRTFADLGAGVREAWRTAEIRPLFVLDICVWSLVGLLISLEPDYVKNELGLGQTFLAVLWSVYGFGELLGALFLTRVGRGAGRELRFAARGLLLAATGFLLYVLIPVAPAAVVANLIFGIGFPFFVAPSNALIQRVARYPGRVTAAFSIVGEGGPVVSAMALAALGHRVEVRPWLIAAGTLFALVALAALRVAARRRPVPAV